MKKKIIYAILIIAILITYTYITISLPALKNFIDDGDIFSSVANGIWVGISKEEINQGRMDFLIGIEFYLLNLFTDITNINNIKIYLLSFFFILLITIFFLTYKHLKTYKLLTLTTLVLIILSSPFLLIFNKFLMSERYILLFNIALIALIISFLKKTTYLKILLITIIININIYLKEVYIIQIIIIAPYFYFLFKKKGEIKFLKISIFLFTSCIIFIALYVFISIPNTIDK
ncbi:MAG: hypothetical protein H6553_00245, partial [Chitinophagales bacterium]|nr:hypothetical protein [Chitinophagales bacterium]